MGRKRASFLAGMRDIAPLVPAGIAVGLVVGAAVAEVGMGLPESVGMSVFVYGASAQLAATLLWGQGAPLLVTVGTALVINARFFIYSASLAPLLDPPTTRSAVAQGYLIRDAAYAATVSRALRDPEMDKTAYYTGASLLDWLVWLVGTSAGALGASLLPASWSLDFMVPLVFVGLLVGAVHGRASAEAAVVAAVGSTILVPLLPMRAGLLAAIALGMVWGFVRQEEVGR